MEDVTPDIADPAPDVSDATPAPDTSSTDTSAETVAAPEAVEAEPAASVFNLDEWDGSIDALPEEVRDLGGAFDKHFANKYKPDLDELEALRGRAKEFESVNAIYQALMNGEEDPRLDDLATQVARSNIAKQEAEAALAALREEYEAFQKQVDAAETAYAERVWSDFAKQHPKLAENTDLIGELLDEGWMLDTIPTLSTLNKKAFEEARKLVKDERLRPDTALELAKHRHPDTKETSRSTVVAGATGPTGNAAGIERKGPINPSYKDKRDYLISRAAARQ